MKNNRQATSDIWSKYPKLKKISKDKFPKHLLIIPDGNGRWAKKHNLPTFAGHKKGAEMLKKVLNDLQDLPIKYVTVWGFSSDNWKRSSIEIKGLMRIFQEYLRNELRGLLKNNKRFIHLGRKDRFPDSLKKIILNMEEETGSGKNGFFSLALDFSGQDQEIRIIERARELPGTTKITKKILQSLRDGKGIIPPADLVIRTSGEQRLSGLGWLGDYAEFYSIKKLLPDSSTQDFIEGLIEYSKRERRFGGRKK